MKNVNDTTRAASLLRVSHIKVAAFVLLPLALAGCKHGEAGTQVAGWQLLEPTQRHPIMVSQEPSSLKLHVASGSDGLTPSQRARLLDFVSHYRASDGGNSKIVIAAPGGSANEGSAMTAAEEARQLIVNAGYAEASIAVEAYHSGGGDAPLRVSYMRYVAEGPECGQDWPENMARNYQNVPYANFGCATQKNLAAMVSNPADLLGPRTMTSRDSNRRDVNFQKYVKGEPIGASDENKTVQKINN